MRGSHVFTGLALVGSAVAAHPKIDSRDLHIVPSVKVACDQLSMMAPNSTYFPNSTAYEIQRVNVWDKRANFYPACIHMPSNADNVAKAVQVFHQNKAPFAVKGGGHMNVSVL